MTLSVPRQEVNTEGTTWISTEKPTEIVQIVSVIAQRSI